MSYNRRNTCYGLSCQQDIGLQVFVFGASLYGQDYLFFEFFLINSVSHEQWGTMIEEKTLKSEVREYGDGLGSFE